MSSNCRSVPSDAGGEDKGLKPVHVLAKCLRVDGLLVNVSLDQSTSFLLDALEPPRQPRLFNAFQKLYASYMYEGVAVAV